MTGVQSWNQIARLELDAGLDPREILFVGLGKSALNWYRCALPALFLGADWAGAVGEPPQLRFVTGMVKRSTQAPILDDYKIVVLQQARGGNWLRTIRKLQERGVKVLYEIDDYLHAIRKMEDHYYKDAFSKEQLRALELCMRVCDGMICSTEFLARRYRRFNKRVWVCENGVDIGRYALTRPERPTLNVLWAGGTGHARAAAPWVGQVYDVMAEREDVGFVSIGQPFAQPFEHFRDRALSIPFTMIDTYPAAMTLGDVAIAPAGKNGWYRAKSDLRWIEAGALGIPVIADPVVYPKIEPGVTGFHAESPEEMRGLLDELLDNASLRLEVGRNAQEYVRGHRDIRVTARQWEAVFREVLDA